MFVVGTEVIFEQRSHIFLVYSHSSSRWEIVSGSPHLSQDSLSTIPNFNIRDRE